MNLRHRMMNLVCIQSFADSQIRRVRHVDAEELVSNGHAIYVPRNLWRANTTHEQRVANASAHSFRTKKGANRGKKQARFQSL